MSSLPITLTIAGAAALMNIWLGLRVSMLRRSQGVLIGHGNNPAIEARMRAHANFVEYAPFFLILLAAVELARGTNSWLWAAGILFIIGRLLHPFGMDKVGGNRLRFVGILLTWLSLVALAAYALSIPYFQQRESVPMPYSGQDRASALSPTNGLLRLS